MDVQEHSERTSAIIVAKPNPQVDPTKLSGWIEGLDKKSDAAQEASTVLNQYAKWMTAQNSVDVSKTFHKELFYVVGFPSQVCVIGVTFFCLISKSPDY